MINDKNILYDLAGYPYNGKYPPRGNSNYHGYDTPKQECLFYDFAVLGYDLMITYRGVSYYFMVDNDGVWLSDEQFSAKNKRFENGNDVLESFSIEGRKLIDIIDELDYAEPY